jgi:UDP-glucose 4-epimerase
LARILVLGGAGFIGSHLVEQLVNQNIETTVFDNFNSGQVENIKTVITTIKLVEDDIRNIDALASSMQGIDWVFHLAAQTSVIESLSNPIFTHEVNNTGTLNVLWAAQQAGVSRVVIASSCSVYGDSHYPPLKELDLPAPKSLYAASKLTAETLAESFYHSYGLEVVCLRYFNVYGRRQRADSAYAAAIPRFIQCYKHKERPQVYGDGLQTRDFIHVTDVARANILAASIPSEV